MRTEVAAVAVVVALIVGAGVGYSGIGGNALTRTERVTESATVTTTNVVTSTQTTTFYSTVSPFGLQLLISLNATTTGNSGSVEAEVFLYNTLDRNLTLIPNYSANKGFEAWDSYNSNCGPLGYRIFDFAVYQGHFTPANLSSAGSPLRLVAPSNAVCLPGFLESLEFASIEFLPRSDIMEGSFGSSAGNPTGSVEVPMRISVDTQGCRISSNNYPFLTTISGTTTTALGTYFFPACGATTALKGYWSIPSNGSILNWPREFANATAAAEGLNAYYSQYYHSFPAGPYTIVAEDLWNQTAFAYFNVGGAPGAYARVLSSSGLKLGLGISSTRFPSGNNITVGLDLTNTLAHSNNISKANRWPIPWLTTWSPCSNFLYPLGFGVAKGHYSPGNLSTATRLDLYNPTVVTACGAAFQIEYYLFEPSSDVATTNAPIKPTPMNGTMSIGGYWSGIPGVYNSGVFHHFDPGNYTLVAGDEWGDVLLLYFTVI